MGKTSLIKDLGPASDVLTNLLERFLTIFGDKRGKICCFYEERKTDFVKSEILWPLRWAVVPQLVGSHPNTQLGPPALLANPLLDCGSLFRDNRGLSAVFPGYGPPKFG